MKRPPSFADDPVSAAGALAKRCATMSGKALSQGGRDIKGIAQRMSRIQARSAPVSAPPPLAYFCNVCRNSSPTALMKGNGWIEFLLYFFYLVPGIIYSFWRRSDPPNLCPLCRHPGLIPAILAQDQVSRPHARDERECPACAEVVLVKAKVCKHCGKDLQG